MSFADLLRAADSALQGHMNEVDYVANAIADAAADAFAEEITNKLQVQEIEKYGAYGYLDNIVQRISCAF